MTVYSWLWVGWIMLFLAVEIPAALTNDKLSHPQSLSMNVWWLIKGKGLGHYWARLVLLLFLAWLVTHLLTGGWV